jgi:uncharacterized Fe-S cluster-containing MiaB family protein
VIYLDKKYEVIPVCDYIWYFILSFSSGCTLNILKRASENRRKLLKTIQRWNYIQKLFVILLLKFLPTNEVENINQILSSDL